MLTAGSAEILPPAGRDAGWLRRQFHYYVGRWISRLWVGAIKLSAAERQITCICHLHRLKFLPYIFMAHCSRALSPSLRWSPTRVWAGAVRQLLWSKISSLFPLHRLQARCTSTRAIASIFGKTCPSLMLLFQSCSSSQVDEVSSVNDGSSWEQSEGSNYWMQASRWRRLKNINIYATENITIAVYLKTRHHHCWTGRKGKDRTDQKQQRMKPLKVNTQR